MRLSRRIVFIPDSRDLLKLKNQNKIKAHNVQAAVITGTYPLEILLGMSFLKQVSIQENAGVMTLVQNF